MLRTLSLLGLLLALSSCILLVEDEPGPITVTDPQPIIITPPRPDTYTYSCNGGRLVVNYVDNNTVRVFYDNAFQTLALTRTSPVRTYAGGPYVWELDRSGLGSFRVGGTLVRTSCRF
ncbi:hypothetical protein [Meiothermus sp. CFH 77666]|uniref:hypothetical protein n=1 Tax=Meiothermus sp. CFH 77666 TaxID=2817942 RepID=UPI001AA080C1|nr:hypothetical protein [Meiothermus sp. CFH 77666]MBO1437026.1 hypothetical protein [Meiothermus sp. CFH 77666]